MPSQVRHGVVEVRVLQDVLPLDIAQCWIIIGIAIDF